MTQSTDSSNFLVVGIGASAGGIEALRAFFAHVPADSGIAYVVILHLSPDYDSQLAQVLQTVAPIPVAQVTEQVRIAPDHVYVVPPNQHLLMIDDHIAVSPNLEFEERRAPVDIFFRTLAESHGAQAVAVVLSGTGANGSMGLKRVKERGGAAFVQNPREAAWSEMPRHAIATDLVDEVLPVAEIPAAIIAYGSRLGTVAIPLEAEARPEDQQQALREVFTQLRQRTGHDFSNYKRPTLLRRIERRINVRNLPNLPAYAAFLREHPEETQALLKDLLISVTNFFRDASAFAAVEREILPQIVAGKSGEDQVRIWVIGCATGEEAYSFAMVCAERTLDVLDAPTVQIFATDIDEAALARARAGVYTLNDVADVSPERLRRFFTQEGEHYRVSRELRDMVLFANHNVLKDPPFGRLDLVTCRNMLIYLNHTAKERVVETVHFALRPSGYLFLGSSESVEGASNMFAVVSREHRIFQSRTVGIRPFPLPESTPSLPAEPRRASDMPRGTGRRAPERMSYGELHAQLLEQYAPPSLVVNEDYDIVHLSEHAGRFLQVTGRELSPNLLQLIRPELRLELRSALYQAVHRQTTVEAKNLQVRIGERTETITIVVRPASGNRNAARGFLLVVFEPSTGERSSTETLAASGEPMVQQLEAEVQRLTAQLRASSEQHDVQAEELKATNEELQALNEELRSAAEELETSKEELQSINEELRTVNQELKVKVEEITQARNNLQNLINSTDWGTIFLDRSFRVALFTPAAGSIFNLIGADHGRPLSDITHRLVDTNVVGDAEVVLQKLQPIEREVRTTDGRSFLMRLLPYRTADDRIGGVVITFLDITERRRAEEATFYLASIVESSEDSMLTVNFDGIITSWNNASERLYGYSAREAIGKPLTMLTLPEDLAEVVRNADRIKDSQKVEVYDTVRVNKDGREMNLEVVLSPVKDSSGRVIGVSTIARDVTERRQAEEALRRAAELDAFRIELTDALRPLADAVEVQAVAARTSMRYFEADRCYYCEIEGGTAVIRQDASREGLPSVVGAYPLSSMPIFKAVVDGGRPFVVHDAHTANILDEELRQLCIQLQVISFIDVPVVKNDQTVGVLCVTQSTPRQWTDLDVQLAQETAERIWAAVERTRAEQAVRESEEKYRTLFDSIDEGYCLVETMFDDAGKAVDFRYLETNPVYERQTGFNMAGKLASEIVPNTEAVWFESLGEVARTGEPLRFENYHEPTGRWYAGFASRVGGAGSSLLALVFDDVTERKRREANLALLADIAEDFARLGSEAEIMQFVGERLARHLRLDGINFAEIDEGRESITVKYNWNAADVPQLVGTFRFAEYMTEESIDTMRAGKTWVVGDTQHDARTDAEATAAIGVGAVLIVPYFREGEWKGCFTATYREAHDWADDEVALIEEVSNRTFLRLDRARAEEALRESESRLAALFEAMPVGAGIVDTDGMMRLANAAMRRYLPTGIMPSRDEARRHRWRGVGEDGSPLQPHDFPGARALRGEMVVPGVEMMFTQDDGTEIWTRIASVPLRDAGGRITGQVTVIDDIDALKRSEEAVRESETRLRTLIENLPGGAAFIVDRDMRYLLAEGEALLDVGVAPTKYVGKTVFEALPAEQAAAYEPMYRAALNGQPFVHEHAIDDRTFVSRGVPLRGANGAIYAVLAVSYDITERKQAEEALRASEARFRTLTDAVPQVIWANDADGKATYFNQRWFTYSGKSLEESFGPGWQVIVHPDDAPASVERWNQALASGTVFDTEYRLRRADGAYRWHIGRNVPLHDAEGHVIGWFGSATDIHDLKAAEAAVREAAERLRIAVEAAQMGTWDWNLETGQVYWNERHFQLFGMEPTSEPINSEAFFTHVHPDERAWVTERLQRAVNEGVVFDAEFRAVRDDGMIRWMSGYGQAVETANGKATRISGVMLDITERKQAEEVLQRLNEELETRVQERTAALTAAHAQRDVLMERIITAQEDERQRVARELHDTLGQFLSALNVRLSIIQSHHGYPPAVGEDIGQLRKLASQIDDEVDRLTIELRPPSLDSLGLQDAIRGYTQEWYATSGIPVEVLPIGKNDTRLPAVVESTAYRVVQEALTNVLKHAQATHVSVIIERRESELRVIIEDDGVGFDPSSQESNGEGGRQVGLIGMRERATLAGGELTIESDVGTGTTIYLHIPLGTATPPNTEGQRR